MDYCILDVSRLQILCKVWQVLYLFRQMLPEAFVFIPFHLSFLFVTKSLVFVLKWQNVYHGTFCRYKSFIDTNNRPELGLGFCWTQCHGRWLVLLFLQMGTSRQSWSSQDRKKPQSLILVWYVKHILFSSVHHGPLNELFVYIKTDRSK